MSYLHLNCNSLQEACLFFIFYIFGGVGVYFDNLHVTSTGTHQQSYSGNNGLADSGTGRLGHVRGDEVLQLINYGVNCQRTYRHNSINMNNMIYMQLSFSYEEIAKFIYSSSANEVGLVHVHVYTFFFSIYAPEAERKQTVQLFKMLKKNIHVMTILRF